MEIILLVLLVPKIIFKIIIGMILNIIGIAKFLAMLIIKKEFLFFIVLLMAVITTAIYILFIECPFKLTAKILKKLALKAKSYIT